jgi:hypothetical protein
MGGNGIRLGMPFPKPLAPTITNDGVVPIYQHTLRQVRAVTSTVYALVRPHTCECLMTAVEADGMKVLVTVEANLPAALGDAGYMIADKHGKDTLVACALPDSIWRLDQGVTMQSVVDVVRGDGALALFEAGADQLDRVTMSLEGNRVLKVETKAPGAAGTVHGWGAFVVRAGALATFTDAEKDGPQLGRLDMGWVYLGQYVDLGTQDRYIRWHDMRWWSDARAG